MDTYFFFTKKRHLNEYSFSFESSCGCWHNQNIFRYLFFLCHMVYLATTNNKSDPQKSECQRNPENLNNFRFYYSEERLKSYSKETGAYVLLQAGEKRYWSHYSSSGWLLREKGLWSATENQVLIKFPMRQRGITDVYCKGIYMCVLVSGNRRLSDNNCSLLRTNTDL